MSIYSLSPFFHQILLHLDSDVMMSIRSVSLFFCQTINKIIYDGAPHHGIFRIPSLSPSTLRLYLNATLSPGTNPERKLAYLMLAAFTNQPMSGSPTYGR